MPSISLEIKILLFSSNFIFDLIFEIFTSPSKSSNKEEFLNLLENNIYSELDKIN